MHPLRQDIAIIGSGCRFPGHANSPSTLWKLVSKPEVVASAVPPSRFNFEGFHHEDNRYSGHGNFKEAYFLAEENAHRCFDASFFGMSPAEAKVLDPQIRLLLETTYEALEASGHTIDAMRGSDTAVYVGQMMADYETIMLQDPDSMGTYHATGTSRAMTANRVSYFFDWRGPSMTIDTACSSSLVAVHEALQQLRTGRSRVAVAAGVNLLLGPTPFISESKLGMLSADGRSRMWDANANGYARGEGIAAVVLKTLADAEADGDHIECIIRETDLGSDGQTAGITMPSAASQADLMRSCYRRAGLDPTDPADRPQYFEAHGTGTRAGDPQEAEAISSTFFPENESTSEDKKPQLYVGSIKTIIGHTEGAAGLAGLIKTSLALQNAVIPQNLLFERLNPEIAPFYKHLHVPIQNITPWPVAADGGIRRASVNSFGFGGANAHAILEAYGTIETSKSISQTNSESIFTPFVFSAASEISLRSYLGKFAEYLRAMDEAPDLRDLAYTLHTRRSCFQVAATITASSVQEFLRKIDRKVEGAREHPGDHFSRRALPRSPGALKHAILGVFTGQGAQWARMGCDMIAASQQARMILDHLESRLSRLPVPPTWSLAEELSRDADTSRIGEAAFSQPLCTAIQIIQVELLKASGVELTAVVGHSSGEIAAAFAAGWISADDAICIAYYRGLHSALSYGPEGQKGSMLAVEGSFDDLQELCEEPEFHGQVCIAAVNSPMSLTLSGNHEAIELMKVILEDEKKFCRLLKVDKAYHSHHMAPCSPAYLASLEALDIQVRAAGRVSWYSSVHGQKMTASGDLRGPYWDRNALSPVLFMQALEAAVNSKGPFDLAIEIGPHGALKGPVLQSIGVIPYTSLFSRPKPAIESCADGLGYVWAHLKSNTVHLDRYDQFLSGNSSRKVLKGLPSYAWDHSHSYWHESRQTRAYLNRTGPVHSLLGHKMPDSTDHELRWRHILTPTQVPWLTGHRLQNQLVFPAAGYVTMALEAARIIWANLPVALIEIIDLHIEQALTFDDENSSFELIFSINNISQGHEGVIEAIFSCYAAATKREGRHKLDRRANGHLRVLLGTPDLCILPERAPHPSNLTKVSQDEFYKALQDIGYQYAGPFVALDNLKRRLGFSKGLVHKIEPSTDLIHPAVLDSVFQSVLLARAAPGDGEIWSIHVPLHIKRIAVNPDLCVTAMVDQSPLHFDSLISSESSDMNGDVDIYANREGNGMVQIQGLQLVPLAKPTAEDDREVFSYIAWDLMEPDAQAIVTQNTDAVITGQTGPEAISLNSLLGVLERMGGFFLRKLVHDIPADHPARSAGLYKHLLNFAAHTISESREKKRPLWRPEWENDKDEDIAIIVDSRKHTVEARLLAEIGGNLTGIVEGTKLPVELGMGDDMLEEAYSQGLGAETYVGYLSRVVKQIVHRYPNMDILEVGAGTGVTTKAVLGEIGDEFASYTFTDISTGYFEKAKHALHAHEQKIAFQPFDLSRDPTTQGFSESAYDLVIASLVLHATPVLQQTLRNCRKLLKPGGHLIVLEILPSSHVSVGVIFGAFPGWWAGAEEGRILHPGVSLQEWDSLLRRSGFSGCDTATPEAREPSQFTVFVSQALDEKVALLREPLAPSSSPTPRVPIEHLVLLGGSSERTSTYVDSLQSVLGPYCETVTTARTVADLRHVAISRDTTILSLVDIDSPVFAKQHHASDWNAIKRMILDAGQLIWVTHGRRATNPHANLIPGLVRSAIREIPSLSYLFLEIEDLKRWDAKFVAKTVLRHCAGTYWQGRNELHVTVEPEIMLDRAGRVLIPRLVMSRSMNHRYNSARRRIASKSDSHLWNLVITKELSGYELREMPFPDDLQDDGGSLQLLTTHSLLSAVRMTELGCMFIMVGTHRESSEQFVALSSDCTSMVRPLPNLSTKVKVKAGFESRFLILAAASMLASTVLEGLSEEDTILVYEPDLEFAEILSAKARLVGVHVSIITKKNGGSDRSGGGVKIHPTLPERTLTRLLPPSIAAFLDFSSQNGVDTIGDRIRYKLPIHCRQFSVGSLFADKGWMPSRSHLEEIGSRLASAVGDSLRILSKEANVGPGNAHTVAVESLLGRVITPHPFRVVDFASIADAPIRMQPAESLVTFSNYKTYWFAGISGELGRSLCEWMVRRGARHFVLSSRRPKDERLWLQEMSSLGADVRIVRCDLTEREQVTDLYNKICSTMPPIGGVVQGAMVLRDTAIRDMSLKDFLDVTGPKVEGSIYLNDLFQEDTLDFFVFLSSCTALVGNPGQANYSAANLFMAGLAQQRRRLGLAASVIHLSPVHGVGILTREEYSSRLDSILRQAGVTLLSERDVHRIFAESILTSRYRPKSTRIEYFTGIRPINTQEDHPPNWKSDPVMNHFVRSSSSGEKVSPSDTRVRMSVREQLAQSESLDQIKEIIQHALLPTICALFQLDPSQQTMDNLGGKRLDEIGIDSLIATEIRNWLYRNLKVEIPVLKILGGITITELVTASMKSIPSSLVPRLVSHPEASSGQEDDATVSMRAPQKGAATLTLASSKVEAASESTASCNSISICNQNRTGVINADVALNCTTHESKLLPDYPDPVTKETNSLSFSQELFWYVWSSLEDKTSLNHTACAHLAGDIDAENLAAAVAAVGQRHEILRVCFTEQEGRPLQRLMSGCPLRLDYKHIRDKSELPLVIHSVQNHIYDVGRGDTVRVVLISLSPREHFLVIGLLPLVLDGNSFQIFLNDIRHQYLHNNEAPMAVSFSQFSRKQREKYEAGELGNAIRFWRSQLTPPPPPLPILSLSNITTRKPLAFYQNESITFKVGSDLRKQVQSVCRRHRATPFHFYVAVLRALLLRYSTDSEDIAIGIADADRTPETTDVLGPFVNFFPLRLRANGSERFEELLQDVRTRHYTAMAHSVLPFQVLLNELDVPRSANYSPIFQCCVNHRQGQSEKMSWGGKSNLHFLGFEVKLPYDIYLEIVDSPNGDSIQTFTLRKELYGSSEAEKLARSYELLLHAFATQPTVPIDQPYMFTQADTEKAKQLSQGPKIQSQWPGTIIHRVDQVANMRPDEPAIVHGDDLVTYKDMMTFASAIASTLKASRAASGCTVAVLQEPSAGFIASFIGIMRIGATYVPLDPGMPTARLAAMVHDCKPISILVDSQTESVAKDLGMSDMKIINVSTVEKKQYDIPIAATANSSAAVLYTSGSTGRPKGVVLQHEGLRNWAEFVPKIHGLGRESVLQQTSPTFDLSLVQILAALCFGGVLHLVSRQQRGDAHEIAKIMLRSRISFTCATPTEYTAWLHYGKAEILGCNAWRSAFCAGEAIPATLLGQFSALRTGSPRLYNLYGPTETSLTATAMEVPYATGTSSEPSEVIAAGVPLPNYSVYVVDRQLRLLPPGVQGEIYIGGAGVGLGYLEKPDETAHHFVADPFSGTGLMHRTGDLGRWRADGALVVEGRISESTQVKLRGLRIDLREVESAIMKAAEGRLQQALVSVRRATTKTPENTDYVVAHVVLKQATLDKEDPNASFRYIQSRLQKQVPLYMLPTTMVHVPKLPTTISGKLDRRAASSLPLGSSVQLKTTDNDKVDLNPMMQRLSSIWREILPCNTLELDGRILPDTDFFHIGGNSLLILRLRAKIEAEIGARVSFERLFESSTLGAMARDVEDIITPFQKDTRVVNDINWDAETELTDCLSNLVRDGMALPRIGTRSEGIVVLLTGSTGHLGRALLTALVADPNVKHVHCLAVRNISTRIDLAVSQDTEKVSLHQGDLLLPRLGLSEHDAGSLVSDADVIIHNGADTSFMKTYPTLRRSNVESTKQLAEMSARCHRMLPIHFISTISVGSTAVSESAGEHFKFAPTSVALYKPLLTASPGSSLGQGYIASKWASEVFLERLSRRCRPSWPVHIHRPSLITPDGDAEPGRELVHNIRHYSSLMRAAPIISSEEGRAVVDLIPLQTVVGAIVNAVWESLTPTSSLSMNGNIDGEHKSPLPTRLDKQDALLNTETAQVSDGVHFLHHTGGVELRMNEVRSWGLRNDDATDRCEMQGSVEYGEKRDSFPMLGIGEWARRAGELGMHPSLVALMHSLGSERNGAS
ncbi:hypothetical protein Hte_006021 [Hypoxylon texense]